MKKRRRALVVLAVLLLGLAGLWYWQIRTTLPTAPLKTRPSVGAKNPAPNFSPAVTSTVNQPPRASPPPPAYGATPASTARNPFVNGDPAALAALQAAVVNDQSKDEIMQAAWNVANSQTLDFYGKVIDQSGDPVVGAKVRGNVLLIGGLTRSESQDNYVETDAQGGFKFVGLHGTRLFVTPEKSGYEYDSRQPTNWNKDYKPEPNSPVVFTMYRLQGAEPMVHVKFDSRVPYDGTSAAFDLSTGKKSNVGNFKITLIRSPLQINRGQQHFDWNVQIEVVGGGLMEATGPYFNLAPEAGYQPMFTFSISKDDTNWTADLTRTFYVHTQQDDYGRINVGLTTDSARPDTGISIEAWVNPSKSRNLEYDAAKAIKSK
jgi:hypothetical protein